MVYISGLKKGMNFLNGSTFPHYVMFTCIFYTCSVCLGFSRLHSYFADGHLSRFINYGYGSLQAVEGIQIHNKLVLGVKLEACAQLCLAETAFKCSSFDYVFGEQSCQMSQLIAANVHGMRTEFDTPYQVMHFELIGKSLFCFSSFDH